MYGAIIGDIVGSKYEFRPIKTKDFPFVSRGCGFTDDTVMTIAVAKALMKWLEQSGGIDYDAFKEILVSEMQDLGRKFPGAGYGGMFAQWLESPDPRPYNSYGNGSAMRVSPCGLYAYTMGEALDLARASAEVTHNHPEGIKGAQAVAACIFLAKRGKTKGEIRTHIEENFYGSLPSVEDVRPGYAFDVTCQGSVPEAIACFLESTGYEDAVRNAVSLGGDADTQAAIAGSIAWTYYRFYGDGPRHEGADEMVVCPEDKIGPYEDTGKKEMFWPVCCDEIVEGYAINEMLPDEFVGVIDDFETCCLRHFSYGERMNDY